MRILSFTSCNPNQVLSRLIIHSLSSLWTRGRQFWWNLSHFWICLYNSRRSLIRGWHYKQPKKCVSFPPSTSCPLKSWRVTFWPLDSASLALCWSRLFSSSARCFRRFSFFFSCLLRALFNPDAMSQEKTGNWVQVYLWFLSAPLPSKKRDIYIYMCVCACLCVFKKIDYTNIARMCACILYIYTHAHVCVYVTDTLHYITLHYITLHCITLHYITYMYIYICVCVFLIRNQPEVDKIWIVQSYSHFHEEAWTCPYLIYARIYSRVIRHM